MNFQKAALLLLLHLWLAGWCYAAYGVFFRKFSERNWVARKRIFGCFEILDRKAYVLYERLFMAVAFPFSLVVYVIGFMDVIE